MDGEGRELLFIFLQNDKVFLAGLCKLLIFSKNFDYIFSSLQIYDSSIF